MVKTLPSKAGSVGLIPGPGAKIPHASQLKKRNKPTKTENKSNIVINPIKNLETVHIKKNFFKLVLSKGFISMYDKIHYK